MSEAQKTIFCAVWEHKRGQAVSAHTTREGAFKQCVTWARNELTSEARYSKTDHRVLSDSDLIESWPEITGDTEFIHVNELLLHKDEEKETQIVDTSHIGA